MLGMSVAWNHNHILLNDTALDLWCIDASCVGCLGCVSADVWCVYVVQQMQNKPGRSDSVICVIRPDEALSVLICHMFVAWNVCCLEA
jgi:hypothetical protein